MNFHPPYDLSVPADAGFQADTKVNPNGLLEPIGAGHLHLDQETRFAGCEAKNQLLAWWPERRSLLYRHIRLFRGN